MQLHGREECCCECVCETCTESLMTLVIRERRLVNRHQEMCEKSATVLCAELLFRAQKSEKTQLRQSICSTLN